MREWPLAKLSGRLFVIAVFILVCGIAQTTIQAPCNESGFWISGSGLVSAALACLAQLILAIQEESGSRLFVFASSVVGTGVAGYMAFVWTILLCRGV